MSTSWSEYMEATDGAFVAVIRVDDEHMRRVVRVTLKAAQTVVERARARGYRAEVVVCRLEAVAVIPAEQTEVAA